ncbi:hypothetical protein [Mariprofundus ferrooxydans]|uniref:hypothetical protein n=1 Tax=Mariprofundus ferrooxydans TaxID=314344 RepID=UPI001E4C0E19|nr:hypothetical protein [Mariprofundus ferrooxydans]
MIVDHIKSFPGTDSRNSSPSSKPVDTHSTIILLKKYGSTSRRHSSQRTFALSLPERLV